jgi:hypothetical protein
MAKRHIVPLGRHKPVRSSWSSMDSMAYSRSYEPEERPEFRVYVTGQQSAMLASYEQHKKAADKRKALAILDSML